MGWLQNLFWSNPRYEDLLASEDEVEQPEISDDGDSISDDTSSHTIGREDFEELFGIDKLFGSDEFFGNDVQTGLESVGDSLESTVIVVDREDGDDEFDGFSDDEDMDDDYVPNLSPIKELSEPSTPGNRKPGTSRSKLGTTYGIGSPRSPASFYHTARGTPSPRSPYGVRSPVYKATDSPRWENTQLPSYKATTPPLFGNTTQLPSYTPPSGPRPSYGPLFSDPKVVQSSLSNYGAPLSTGPLFKSQSPSRGLFSDSQADSSSRLFGTGSLFTKSKSPTKPLIIPSTAGLFGGGGLFVNDPNPSTSKPLIPPSSPRSPLGPNQTFETFLLQNRPSSKTKSSGRRPFKEWKVKDVDPLRYHNRLGEPRRLPNTPTKSHLPPSPRRKGPKPRACPTCQRAFRVAKKKTGTTAAKKGKKAAVVAAAVEEDVVVEDDEEEEAAPRRSGRATKKPTRYTH